MIKNNNKKTSLKRIFNPRWLLLDIAKITVWPSFTLFFRTKKYFENAMNNSLPHGKAIIVANHPSIWEPPVMVHAFFRRRLRFVINQQIFEHRRFFETMLKKAGGIGIDKNNFGMEDFRKILTALDDDDIVVVFPEGEMSNTGDLIPFKSGVVMMALQSGAPILPVYINKTDKLWHRKKIVIGSLINVKELLPDSPSMKQIDAAAQSLHDKVCELKELLVTLESKSLSEGNESINSSCSMNELNTHNFAKEEQRYE